MPKSWKEQKYKGKLTLTRTARDVQSDLQSFQFPSHWRLPRETFSLLLRSIASRFRLSWIIL